MHPTTRKEKEVWQAINLLQSEGFNPEEITGEMIGARLLVLGFNRGSNSDISRYRKSWLSAHSKASAIPHDHPSPTLLSDPLNQALSHAVQTLKEQLHRESQAEIAKIRKECESAIEEANKKVAVAQQEAAHALKEEEKVHIAITTIRTQNLGLEKMLAQQQEEITQKQQRIDELANDKNTHEKEIQRLQDLLKTQLEQLEKTRTSLIADHHEIVHKLIDQQEMQRHTWMLETDQLKTKNHQLQNELTKLEKMADEMRHQMTSLENTHTTLLKEVNERETMSALLQVHQIEQDKKLATQTDLCTRIETHLSDQIEKVAISQKSAQTEVVQQLNKVENILNRISHLPIEQLMLAIEYLSQEKLVKS